MKKLTIFSSLFLLVFGLTIGITVGFNDQAQAGGPTCIGYCEYDPAHCHGVLGYCDNPREPLNHVWHSHGTCTGTGYCDTIFGECCDNGS